jgi:hypothetical protein
LDCLVIALTHLLAPTPEKKRRLFGERPEDVGSATHDHPAATISLIGVQQHPWGQDAPELGDEPLPTLLVEVVEHLVQPVEEDHRSVLSHQLDYFFGRRRPSAVRFPGARDNLRQNRTQVGIGPPGRPEAPEIQVDGHPGSGALPALFQEPVGEELTGGGLAHAVLAQQHQERPGAGVLALRLGRSRIGLHGTWVLGPVPTEPLRRYQGSLQPFVQHRLHVSAVSGCPLLAAGLRRRSLPEALRARHLNRDPLTGDVPVRQSDVRVERDPGGQEAADSSSIPRTNCLDVVVGTLRRLSAIGSAQIGCRFEGPLTQRRAGVGRVVP